MMNCLKKHGFALILTHTVFVGILMVIIHIMILMIRGTEILRKIHGLISLRGEKQQSEKGKGTRKTSIFILGTSILANCTILYL